MEANVCYGGYTSVFCYLLFREYISIYIMIYTLLFFFNLVLAFLSMCDLSITQQHVWGALPCSYLYMHNTLQPRHL